MLSESARNCAFVFHARLLELCFLGGLVCRRSFWTLFGFKISAGDSDHREENCLDLPEPAISLWLEWGTS